ncbi:MAG: zinc ribbon domain-containing protein [Rudaea sp.]
MATIERICPQCGTGNASDRSRCSKCGAALANLPVPGGRSLPARREGPGTGALILSATALIARAGFRLFRKEILPRLARELANKPSTAIIDQPRGADVEKQRVEKPASEPEPDYTIRGWRAWSVRHNDQQSSGSETFEWRISRRRDGGAGRE